MAENYGNASGLKPSLGNPVNHYKYCPRCASQGDFNCSDNSFKCPACGFHFFLNAAAAVTALIFNDNNELLLVRRGIDPAIGMLDLPGGFVNAGESVEQAVVREIKEELNLTPSSISFYGSFPNEYLFSGCIVNTVDLVFVFKVESFLGMKCMDDVSDVEFVFPEVLDSNLIAFQSSRNILKQLIDERRNCKKD